MFDQLTTARNALAEVARVDMRDISASSSVRMLEELGTLQRMLDGIVARAAKHIEDAHAHAIEGDRNAGAMVARVLGTTCGEARSVIETARRLEALPVTAAAVERGEVSAKQAELIAEAASCNPAAEAELLAAAAQGLTPLRDACAAARNAVEDPAERVARQRKLRTLRMWTDTDGMVAGSFRLTPEVGGELKQKIDAEVQRMFRSRRAGDHEPHDAYAADALAQFALAESGGGAKKQSPYYVHVVVGHGLLTEQYTADGETCEIPGVGPVDVEWVRSLLGEAFLTAVVKKGKDISTVAHLGRHVPAEVQTALIVGGRECRIEGCYCRGYLERDHVFDYAKGGPTALENLEWLCPVHHDLKSKGWVLSPPDPVTGKCTLRPPRGRMPP